MTLSPNTVTSLPQVLTGQITNFVAGQTVSFRLDNQTTGQVLTGSITPSTVPANGTAAVSVTLPSGVSNGSHTIYAIGSGADRASADVTVAVPTTITTSAFAFADSSNGTEAVRNEPQSFASDGVTQATTNWNTSFAANRFVDYTMNSPLRPGQNISSANFNFRYAGTLAATQYCFYVEVRNGAGTVLSTHGSGATPFGCVTGTTQTNFTVPISSGVTSTDIANDLVIRIYGRAAVLGAFTVDRATVSGSGTDGSFELFPHSVNDAADSTPAAAPWALAFDDDTALTNSGGFSWTTSYGTSKYMVATFPAYVPSGATIQSATLTHVYRANSANRQICNYVETFAGASSIGTHGSAGSDLSCSSSDLTDVTDTIPLPEVDTVAEANSLSARIYMKRSATGTTLSRHDQVRLSITYVK
jgi:hypothetical protein